MLRRAGAWRAATRRKDSLGVVSRRECDWKLKGEGEGELLLVVCVELPWRGGGVN